MEMEHGVQEEVQEVRVQREHMEMEQQKLKHKPRRVKTVEMDIIVQEEVQEQRVLLEHMEVE